MAARYPTDYAWFTKRWAMAIFVAAAWVGVARGADADATCRETATAIAEDAVALRAIWLKAFLRLNAAGPTSRPRGEAPTTMVLSLSSAVMAKDVKVFVLRVGTDYAAGDAWIPAFNMPFAVAEVLPPSKAGSGANQTVTENVTLIVPKRLLLEEQDVRMTFAVTLKPSGSEWTGTYRVRVGTADKTGAATALVRPLAAGDGFPADYPAFKAAGKSAADVCQAAADLETEVCRRYRDLLWIDARTRGLARNGAPDYPAPARSALQTLQAQTGGAPTKAAVKKEKAPGIEDVGDLDGLTDDVVKTDKPKTGSGSAASGGPSPAALEALNEVREHLARLRAVAERFVDPAAKPDLPIAAAPACADPLFGPWYGFAPLPSEKVRINILPAGVGGPGRQEWRYVDRWKALGPIPADAPSTRCAALPHRFFLPGAVYAIFQQYLPKPKATDAKADDTTPEPDSTPQAKAIAAGMHWMSWDVEPATGILRPPQWYEATGSGYGAIPSGTPNTTWFAATEIHSEADCEPWIAIGADDDAQLWINDRLVAAWPDNDRRQDMESPMVFRTAFRKGKNTVLARIRQLRGETDKEQATSCVWMRICTQGAPSDPAATAAREKAVSERQKTLRPFGPEVRGYRGNWLGLDPDVRPVTAWDLDKRINVAWSIGLPQTISTPLLVGHRILTTGMPHNLFCVDKMTGKVLWRATFDLLDILEPAVAAQAKPLNDAYLDLQAQVFRRATYPPDTSTETFQEGGKEMPAKDAVQRSRAMYRDLTKVVEDGLKKHGHSLFYLWSGYMGSECATPVTDGKHVWLRSASGAAACFTLEGERKWLVELPHRSSAYNAYTSPLLVDGLFIVEVVPDDKVRPGGHWAGCEWRDVYLIALDAATGKERWRTQVFNTIGTSSPIAMRITDGKEDMAVVVTGGSGNARLLPDGRFQGGFLGGTVVRVADGKKLISNLSVNTGYGTAVAVGDVVYHCGLSQMTATRLLMRDRDTLGAKRLWTQPFFRGLEPCVTPHDGKLFANVAIGCVGGQGHAGYAVFDASTGRELPRHVNVDWRLFTTRSAWGSAGRCYVPTAIAGPFVFIGDEGEGFGGKACKGPLSSEPYANCVVLEAREQGRLIAQNALPPRSNSGFLFDEDTAKDGTGRMYYRNTFGMMCLAYTGDEGKAFEAETHARFVLEDLDLEAPETGAATAVAPQPALPAELPRQDDLWTRYSRPFLIMGPVKAEARAGVLDALNGKIPWARGILEPKVPAGRDPGPAFTATRLRSFGRAAMVTHGGFEVFRDWETAGKPAGQTAIFATVMRMDQTRTVRFISRTKSARVHAWLGGAELKHQQRYRLEPGEYAYVAEMDLGEPSDDVRFDFYFVRSAEDPKQDVAAWREDLTGARTYLERAVKLTPDSETGKKAAAILKSLPVARDPRDARQSP